MQAAIALNHSPSPCSAKKRFFSSTPTSPIPDSLITQAAQFIRDADCLLVTAGAGMGVDSGLPDFRGDEGFWKAYPVLAGRGIDFRSMANPSWFESYPRLAWAFYGHRMNLYRRTTPHAGFKMLLEWMREKKEKKNQGSFVFTSNVDGQFQQAGFPDEWIYECHGSIHYLQCTEPCSGELIFASPDSVKLEIDEEKFLAELTSIPPCPRHPACQRIARPNVLMFGDYSFVHSRVSGQDSRYYAWKSRIRKHDVSLCIIELGAGTAIPSVRMQSDQMLDLNPKNRMIRINLREPHSSAHPSRCVSLPLSCLKALSLIKSFLK